MNNPSNNQPDYPHNRNHLYLTSIHEEHSMEQPKDFSIFEKLFRNMGINVRYLQNNTTTMSFTNTPDWYTLDEHRFIVQFSQRLFSAIEDNTLYHIHVFLCDFICLKLQHGEEPTYMVIGPYKQQPYDDTNYYSIINVLQLKPEQFQLVKQFYENIPIITHEKALFPILYTLGEWVWGNSENFKIVNMTQEVLNKYEPLIHEEKLTEPESLMKLITSLEEHYSIENQLILAVSQGQSHKALLLLDTLISDDHLKNTAENVRKFKNLCHMINTLLRKGAEYGSVHPYYIENLSDRFLTKIETLNSIGNLRQQLREFLHKYCILVKNHSMKGYSILVQKVLLRIDSDLTADLSLSTQAELLKINSSYLSTLFRKEVGTTLTDYVNKKRIEHAIFLLNTTSMQIQTIAQHCGIPDVNYFTKTFKKHVGKTPKEYRDSITTYKKYTK